MLLTSTIPYWYDKSFSSRVSLPIRCRIPAGLNYAANPTRRLNNSTVWAHNCTTAGEYVYVRALIDVMGISWLGPLPRGITPN